MLSAFHWRKAARRAAPDSTFREEMDMRKTTRTLAAIALSAGGITLGACGGGHDRTTTAGGDVSSAPSSAPTTAAAPANTTTAATHHSKLGGALAGAAVGHVLGGHAVAGAAAGALIQHERNKHAH
jgi:hypothetical protein